MFERHGRESVLILICIAVLLPLVLSTGAQAAIRIGRPTQTPAIVSPTPSPTPRKQSGIRIGPKTKPTVKPNTGGGIRVGSRPQSVMPSPIDANVSFSRRAVMIYMVGSDLESEYEDNYASIDLRELIDGQIDTSASDVFICAGGTKKWGLLDNTLGNGEVAYYQLLNDGLFRITEPRHISMGNPSTLSDFLNYCVKHSRADTFDLILWNHGGGPLNGFGWDETHLVRGYKDNLTMEELVSALESSPFNTKNKLEILGFHACLMGTLEVAAILSPYARYMIASENVMRVWGFDYTACGGKALSEMSTTDLMSNIVQKSISKLRRMKTREILSVFDLSQVAGVTAALNNIFSDQYGCLDDASLRRIIDGIVAMDKPETYDLYDLYAFADALSEADIMPQEALMLKKAIEKMVVLSEHNSAAEGLSGCAFFFPLQSKDKKYYVVNQYPDVSKKASLEQYSDYLCGYIQQVGLATGKALPPMVSLALGNYRDHSAKLPDVLRQKDVQVANALELVAEGICYSVPVDMMLDDLVRFYYTILEQVGTTDTYRLVEQGRGLELTEDGDLQVTLANGIRMIRGGDDQAWQEMPCFETIRYDGVQYYFDTDLLYRKGSQVSQMNGNIIVNMQYPNGSLDSLSPISEDPMPIAVYEEALPGNYLTPVYQYKKLTLDQYGCPLPFAFWEDVGSGRTYGTEFKIQSGGVQVAQLPCSADKKYFVQLCVVDAKDTTYATGLVPLN